MARALHWLPVVSALCQLVGTALVVWGLKITSNPDPVTFKRGFGTPLPSAGIVREHQQALTWGVWLLLAGLALQVVVAVL